MQASADEVTTDSGIIPGTVVPATAISGQNENEKLAECICNVNQELGEVCVVREDFDFNKSLIAVCTPFMKRVHEHVAECGEIVYVESAGGFDHREVIPRVAGAPAPKAKSSRIGYRVVVFMTHSKAGGMGVYRLYFKNIFDRY